jgi:hypothetical protein
VSFENVPFWEAVGFQDRLAQWIVDERPAVDIMGTVVAWVERQLENPYAGMHRETSIAANLWWGRIPGTLRDDTDVLFSYWIDEEMRTIRCDSIATLGRPN